MEKIKDFLTLTSGSGYGSGYGDGAGSGDGDGAGYGYGSGSGSGSGSGEDGSGSGSGYGSGAGYGDGDGYGSGSGYGDGSGSGSGYGSGYGDGAGYGSGDGDGSGYGYGDGYSDGLKSIDFNLVYYIDSIPTIFKKIKGNVAKCEIINRDFTTTPCYVVKNSCYFAHGETLKEAMDALLEKQLSNMSEEERISEFISRFPDYNKEYQNKDFFDWHSKLTGSCEFGRLQFAKEHDIDLGNKMTVENFISLTEDSYNGVVIKKLKETYLEK